MTDRRKKKEMKRKKRKDGARRDNARQKPKSPFEGLVAKRECGGCTACCTVFAIPEVATGKGEKCQHECEAGCAIYTDRPRACVGFECAWLAGWGEDDDRPDKRGWIAYSEPAFPQFAQLAGAGSGRKYPVCIRDLGSKEELLDAHLQQTIYDFVQARAAVLVHGEDENGRWCSLYGPRLPMGLTMTFEELERMAEGASPKCFLCASPLVYQRSGSKARMVCSDAQDVQCAVHGPYVPVGHGKAGAVARYNEWAVRTATKKAEEPSSSE